MTLTKSKQRVPQNGGRGRKEEADFGQKKLVGVNLEGEVSRLIYVFPNFFQMGHPGLFFVYVHLFKQTLQQTTKYM